MTLLREACGVTDEERRLIGKSSRGFELHPLLERWRPLQVFVLIKSLDESGEACRKTQRHRDLREATMAQSAGDNGNVAAERIDRIITELGDWRGETLSRGAQAHHGGRQRHRRGREVGEADEPNGVPTESLDGIICTGNTYKSAVKLTFAQGAMLDDPAGLFNSSPGRNTRRAIDFREGDKVDTRPLKALVRAAVARNVVNAGTRRKKS